MRPKLRLASSVLLTALTSAALFGGGGRPQGVSAQAASAKPRRVSAAAFSAPAGYIVHGAHISPVAFTPHYYDEIANFQTAVGRNVGIVMYFLAWSASCDNGYLPGYVDGSGPPPGTNPSRVIMITWEPFDPATYSTSNPGAAKYDNIINGSYDSVITTCANALKAWSSKKFLLRFMHEFNITQSYWWAGHSYNLKADGTGDTAKFIQAWRHVHDLFVAAGVTNVEWLWAPNYASNPDVPWNAIYNYYPGDAYVDWIGLSGYNWYTSLNPPTPLLSYSDLYNNVLIELQCRYPKPIVHNEIGTMPYNSGSFVPANQEAWITDAYQKMQTYPMVRAVTWFNDYAYHNTDQADFRVWTNTNPGNYGGSSPYTTVPVSVTNAYATAVSDSSFTPTYDSSKLLNPPMTRCASDSVSNNGVLGVRPATNLVGKTGTTTTNFSVGALGLSSDTNFTPVHGVVGR